jgi:hypothetical protein
MGTDSLLSKEYLIRDRQEVRMYYVSTGSGSVMPIHDTAPSTPRESKVARSAEANVQSAARTDTPATQRAAATEEDRLES